MKRLFLVAVVLALVAALGAGGFLLSLNSKANAPGLGTEEIELEVPRGANARSVGVQLQKVGLVGDTLVFRYVVWKRGGLALKARPRPEIRGLFPLSV